MIKAIIDIFTPKGEITGGTFAINYLILRMTYFILTYISTYILFNADQTIPFFNFLSILFLILIVVVEVIILFNYKKRILNICQNFAISIILAILFTFAIEIMITIFFSKYFIVASTINLIIIPIIVAIIPPKNADIKEYWTNFRHRTFKIAKHPITICAIALIASIIAINNLSKIHNEKVVNVSNNEQVMDLVINPLTNYTNMEVKEIEKLRKKYVNSSIFSNSKYEPSLKVFGQMQDKKAWWALNHAICYSESEDRNIRKDGPSEESRFINNPNMLLGVLVSQYFEKTPIFKDFCNDETLYMLPKSLTYNERYKLITATYKSSQNFTKKFGNNNFVKFLISGLNARDFGYNYGYAINTQNVLFYPPIVIKGYSLEYGVVKFEDHIALGKACEVDGGCNNSAPFQQNLEFRIMKLPAEMTIALWKHKPVYKNQPANMYYKIRFE